MNFKRVFALSLVLLVTISFAQPMEDLRNHKFRKFSSAKKEVFLASVSMKTFYCGCPFDKEKNIDLAKCGYHIRKSKKRAARVEVEHVVPADRLCGKTPEWQNGSSQCTDSRGKSFKGRRCASEYNDSCVMAYNDLHNLRPAIGEINNDRSDYWFADLPSAKSNYGACDFRIHDQKVDPPANVHGDIARIYLHMNLAYPELKILNLDEIDFFKKWSASDPVSKDECDYDEKIFQAEGVHNQFIYLQCDYK